MLHTVEVEGSQRNATCESAFGYRFIQADLLGSCVCSGRGCTNMHSSCLGRMQVVVESPKFNFEASNGTYCFFVIVRGDVFVRGGGGEVSFFLVRVQAGFCSKDVSKNRKHVLRVSQ